MIVNEELELNSIVIDKNTNKNNINTNKNNINTNKSENKSENKNDNKNDNKNKDKESKYCCICLNTNKDNFIKLKCCKQFIHKGCIIELVVNNDVFNCPICRSKIRLCDSITFGKIIDYINYKKIHVSSEKMKTIITHLYNSYQFKLLFNTENTDSAEINHLKETVTKLMIENSKLKFIILITSIPLIIFTIITFSRPK